MPISHPPELKAAFLTDAPILGITKAAAKHGISKGTGSRWANDAGIETVRHERTAKAVEAARLSWQERKAEMVNDLGDLAADTLKVIRRSLRTKPRTASDLSRVLCAAIDKAQLLSGGQTARHGLESREEVLTDARDRALHLVNE